MDMFELKTALVTANANHDREASVYLIDKFMPTIKKNAKILNCDGAESDLVVAFIEFIYGLEPKNLLKYSEAQLVSFTVNAIKNKRIDIYRKNSSKVAEIVGSENALSAGSYQIEDGICFRDLLTSLTERQRLILIALYLYGYKEHEVAKKLKISQQAVSDTKRRSLEILRKNY